VTCSCAYDITLQNSFIVEPTSIGIGLHQAACRLQFYNNTVYGGTGAAVQLFDGATEIDFRNNIFDCPTRTDATRGCVQLGAEITQSGAGSVWDYNTINTLGGGAMRVVDYTGGSGTMCQDHWNDVDFPCAESTCDPGGDTNWLRHQSRGFVASSQPGLAAGFATHDQWNVGPTFVGPLTTVAGLHLSPSDTIAVDQGVTLGAVTTDIDGQSRPIWAAYDLGADEMGNATPTRRRRRP